MENTREIKRGEMYYANFCPNVGNEQGGIRPVLVIQNDRNNKTSTTTIVAAMTGKKKKKQRTHVNVSGCGLKKETIILLNAADRAIVESFGIKYLEVLVNGK